MIIKRDLWKSSTGIIYGGCMLKKEVLNVFVSIMGILSLLIYIPCLGVLNMGSIKHLSGITGA